jgi:NitT/TauT family transport system ATP-binding protein
MTISERSRLDDDERLAEMTRDLPTVVSVDRVSKSFPVSGRAVSIIDSISLSVRAGEVVSIVGPSGCGKTTLLRMIQGLERPSSGSIAIEGRSVQSGNVNAGFVFQQAALFPWFSLERNIGFGLGLRASATDLSRSEQTARVRRLIDLVGLTGYADYRPHELSGGMRQRANLARALAVDPAVLLLDEPFSAVDTLTRERLQCALADLLGELGTTAILVTHDIREAVFLGSRVIVMAPNPGRIVSEHRIDLAYPRTEEIQHGTQLARLAQSIYADLRRIDQPQVATEPGAPITGGIGGLPPRLPAGGRTARAKRGIRARI